MKNPYPTKNHRAKPKTCLGLALLILTPVVLSGQEEEVETLDVFEVYSTAQENAVERRRQSDTIGSFLGSDTLGELPDDDLGEALSRLAGVNVIGGQGIDEGNVVIRGADGQYNSIRINGASQANARLGSRLYDVNQIPAEMVSSVEVLKSITAEYPADSIGGAVNVETATAFEIGERTLRYKLEGRYRDQGEADGYGGNLIYSDVYSVGGGESNLGLFFNLNFVNEDLFVWNTQNRFLDQENRLSLSDAENEDIANASILDVNPNATQPIWDRFDPNENRVNREEITFNASLDFKLGERTELFFRPWYQKSEQLDDLMSVRLDRVERIIRDNFWFNDESGNPIGSFEDTDGDGVLGSEDDVFIRGTDSNGDLIITDSYEGSRDGRIRRQVRTRDEESETFTLDFGGETFLDNGLLDYRILFSSDEGSLYDREWRFQENSSDANSGNLPFRMRITDGSTPLPEFIVFEVTENRGHVPADNERDIFGDVNRNFTDTAPLFKLEDISEEVLLGAINYEHDFTESFTVKTGLRYRKAERENAVTQLFFQPDGVSGRSVLPINQIATRDGPFTIFDGKYADSFGPFYRIQSAFEFFQEDLASNPDNWRFDRSDLRDAADTADLQETITAAYLQGTYRWKDLTLIGGIRYEQTDLETTWRADNFQVDARNFPGLTSAQAANMNAEIQETITDIGFIGSSGGFNFGDIVDNISNSNDYENWLPSFVATWRVGNSGHLFRFAWTNTLSRPDYRELVPYDGAQVNQQLANAGVINLTNREDEFDLGNPGLTEQTSENLDLGWEFYFGEGQRNTISVTAFRKDLENFLQEDTFARQAEVLIDPTDPSLGTELVDGDVNFWSNASERTIEGLEFSSYLSARDLLPDWTWLHGLGVSANYTYITGDQTDPIFDEDELANGNFVVLDTVSTGNLTNQAEDIINFQLFYQIQRLNLRMSYNYISEVQRTPSTAAISDTTFDTEQEFLDLSLQYRLFQDTDLRLFLEVDNLTEEVQDERYVGLIPGLYTTSYETVGRRYVFGVRGSF